MVTDYMIKSFDGTNLFLKKEIAKDSKAVAVIVHGLCEHQGRYDYLAKKLLECNISVYRFDHRGHGHSEGKKVYYAHYNEIADDINEVVKLAISENEALPIFIIGHSMGGYATSLFVSRYPNKIKGAVLSGALTRMNKNLLAALPSEALDSDYLPNQLGGNVCSDPAVVEAYANDPLVEKEISVALFRNVAKGVEWLTQNPEQFKTPVLIMHGADDGIVSEKDSRDLFASIVTKDKTLMIFGGMQHEIFNEYKKDRVIEHTISWILDRI